jgi:uncharacterized protein YcbX
VWILDFSNGVYWFVGLVCSCCLFAMSCPEILATWVSGETGFQWDRQWMLVNERGRFITQRTEPKIALVKVSLPPEVLHDSWGPLPKNACLCFDAPGMQQLKVPLVPSAPLKKIDQVTVWQWSGPGLLEGPDATRWFTEYLGKPARLIRLDNDSMNRATDPKYAAGFPTAFSDQFPFLMISQASLDALNERLPIPLPINRFRPNIFIEGCEPWAEDTWDTFTIGKYTFHGVKLSARCKITTTDQSTAEVGEEPLVTLRTFRAGKHLSSLHDMRNGVRSTCPATSTIMLTFKWYNSTVVCCLRLV